MTNSVTAPLDFRGWPVVQPQFAGGVILGDRRERRISPPVEEWLLLNEILRRCAPQKDRYGCRSSASATGIRVAIKVLLQEFGLLRHERHETVRAGTLDLQEELAL